MTTESITVEANKLLHTVSHTITSHEKHANLHGENFNIFSILRRETREVETHSRFIYELLNKNGSHGQGDLFLKLFISDVLNLSNVIGNNIQVKREDQTHENGENRRIDFTLTSEKYVIAIELKIYASDQSSQLYDYNEEIKKRADSGKETKCYYLTLHGKEASDESLKSSMSSENTKTLSSEDYTKISFNKGIIDWLNNCINAVSMKHVIREALFQYLTLIEKLVGRRQQMTEQIAEVLTKSPENLKSAIQIEKSLTTAKINIQKNFWGKLEGKLKTTFDKDIIVENRDQKTTTSISDLVNKYYKNTKNTKHFGLRFKVCDHEECQIWAYFNLYDAFHYGIRVKDSSNNLICYNKREKIRNILGKGNAVADKDNDWLICFYHNPNIQEHIINFNDFNDVAQSLTDKDELEKIITSITNHIKEIIDKVCKGQ